MSTGCGVTVRLQLIGLRVLPKVDVFLRTLLRDPDDAAKGSVRWEMDPQGEYRTRLDGPDDVRAFTCGFLVRGFDIDEGLPLDLGKAVDTAELETEAIAPALPGGGP